MDQDRLPNIQLPQSWASDWELVRPHLGFGSYSTVFRAVRKDHPGIDAAIKIITIPANDNEIAALISEGYTADQSQSYYDDVARAYVSEIEMMEELKGTQHIVGIEDYKVVRRTDAIGNYIFIRMELLTPLESVIRERNLSEQEVLRIGINICNALELCGAKNILHRDIKPANIFINDKTPGYVFYKLGDFGVARSMQSLTHGLSTKGTPNYMAPEVFTGKPYDQRADLYSLGITLYRLLNNNCLPFINKGDLSVFSREGALARRMGGEKLPPPCRGSEASCQAILKACEYNPDDRYANASEMRAALEAALYQKAINASEQNKSSSRENEKAGSFSRQNSSEDSNRSPQQEKPAQKAVKRERFLIAVAVFCALAAIVVLLYGLFLRPSTEPFQSPTPLVTETMTPSPSHASTPSLPVIQTETPTSTLTLTHTSSPTPTPSSSPTHAPSSTPALTPILTPTSTLTPTASPPPTPTPTPTSTLTPTASPPPTPTPTPTSTLTPTVSPTLTPTPAPTSRITDTTTSYNHVKNGDTWICDNCEEKNSFDNIFCTNCGQTKQCLECGHSVPKEDMFCTNCGTEIGKWKCSQCGNLSGIDDAFCVNCGTKRHKPATQQ